MIETNKLTVPDMGKRVLFIDDAGEETEGRLLSWIDGRVKVLCREHVRELDTYAVALECGSYAEDE